MVRSTERVTTADWKSCWGIGTGRSAVTKCGRLSGRSAAVDTLF
ncbi:MAG: hypothetical protein PHE53_03300 [Thermoguttaceae bacterium]|nr:hypothetical protein [Thermoguttaceae bacterium]